MVDSNQVAPPSLTRRSLAGAEMEAIRERHMTELKREVLIDDHLIPLELFYLRHDTNPETGLRSDQAAWLLAVYGPNKLKGVKQEPRWLTFLKNFFGGFALMLWCGAALCFLKHFLQPSGDEKDHLYLAGVLITVVIVTGFFTHYQQRKSANVLEAFETMMPQFATVVRDGRMQEINADDVVLGDVVDLKAGDRVPADMRIVECRGLKVDNSALTGESEPQRCSTEPTSENPLESHNLAFYSTPVVEGAGRGVVIGRGDYSVMGRIAELTTGLSHTETPIAREIRTFVRAITIVALVLGGIVSLLAFMVGYHWLEALMFFIGIIIANVPEGLLVTVTMCLTLSAQRMARKNCLIKNLEAVEALGATSVICSDKTGTLTQNRMTVSHVWMYGSSPLVVDTSPVPVMDKLPLKTEQFRMLIRVAALCSRAQFDASTPADVPVSERRVFGDATEVALLKFTEVITGGVKAYRAKWPKVCEIPFNSDTKWQASVHSGKLNGAQHLLVLKGAPERVLDLCSEVRGARGNEKLDGSKHKEVLDTYAELGALGERVIGFCDLALPENKYPKGYRFDADKRNFPLTGLRFVGLISMIDPPRPAVPEAVRKCRSAGIRIAMVTGDHPTTATAIARAVGIVSAAEVVEVGGAWWRSSTTPRGSGTVVASPDVAAPFHPSPHHSALRLPSRPQSDLSTNIDPTSYRRLPVIAPRRSVSHVAKRSAGIVNGADLREWSSDELDHFLRTHEEYVFARTSPTQKLFIVEAFQRLDYIVAVTGDGVNDSPALKRADIGVAMGVAGSDVAKQAADIILLDDNFATIVSGVEEGRIIFDNLKKSIAYTLTSNTPEMLPFVASVIFKVPLPLGVMAIMCINVGTDLAPAISLAYEPAESDIMNRKPRGRGRDPLVNARLISISYVQVGLLQAAAGFYVYFIIMAENGFLPRTLLGLLEQWNSEALNDLEDSWGQQWTYKARKELEFTCHTGFFAAIVVVQWADLLICKTRRLSLLQQGMRNWPLNFSLLFCSVLAAVFVYAPGMDEALRLYPLPLRYWLYPIPFAFAIVFYDEVRRFLIRQHPGGWVERTTYY